MLLALGFAAMDLKQKHTTAGVGGGRHKQHNPVLAHSIEIVCLEGKTILYFPSTPR